MKNLFSNRAFLLVTISDILQQLAIWIRNMALLYFVMERTNNDPISVSLLSVMEYAPIFIFSFVGGALADRWNPNRTMVAGDMLSVCSIIGIIVLLKMDYWQAIFFATLVSAIVGQFSQPSSSKIFKRYVEEKYVSNAIAFNQTLQSLFLIFGPVIGSVVYTQLGVFTALYSLIGLFLLSALALSFLPIWIEKEEKVERTLGSDIKEGWKFVLQTKNVSMITVAFAIIGLAVGLTNPLEVFLVIERLGLNKEAVQYLAVADGIGMLIGGGVAAIFASKVHPKKMFVFGMFVLALSFLVEGVSTSFWLTSFMRFGTGICLACVNIVVGTLMIQLVPENMVGRVNGTILPIFMGAMLMGNAFAGGVKEVTSIIVVFCIAMLLSLMAILPILRMNIGSAKVTNQMESTKQNGVKSFK
ncbi:MULTISPECIES: MFS transporter [Bacillus cereus group]|uniref:Major facilitator superfamily MFS_1 n=1 Tax=Bacillus cytotoxicus (strain DSM 22905 / CIP 110041 / 391-98 / NVH 391-98) TaxID=315749 RepID=A7GKS7_BACCN|nr:MULTISPECIES: MFS transporter [Bacillus cereus group]ABS20735.1 major facilitator superfamily MFS_1 [Bacillus cytotoxicus NVH 391-98]AWC43475.1 MFS transporter [Bacillus cytotoxicus]MDH2865336.1 MFS transporter [Bacillus cytotoxicus]MDH2879670.1 MFS transporter [Bacillus cytotoxicus]MDH2885129.1 MFS transporter [Bacillus cytotoxicus]